MRACRSRMSVCDAVLRGIKSMPTLLDRERSTLMGDRNVKIAYN